MQPIQTSRENYLLTPQPNFFLCPNAMNTLPFNLKGTSLTLYSPTSLLLPTCQTLIFLSLTTTNQFLTLPVFSPYPFNQQTVTHRNLRNLTVLSSTLQHTTFMRNSHQYPALTLPVLSKTACSHHPWKHWPLSPHTELGPNRYNLGKQTTPEV